MTHCSLTAKELNRIFEDRFTEGRLTHSYIRYLYAINPDLWTPVKLGAEYGVHPNVIMGIIGKRQYLIERRKGERRRSGQKIRVAGS